MQSYLIARENPEAAPFLGPEIKPRSIAEVGLRTTFLEGIALKTLYMAGKASILELAERTRLSFEAATEIFERLRTDQLCQVTGMTGTVAQFAITAAGRARAMELLTHSHYSGIVPVSLESYVDQTRKQRTQKIEIHFSDVERAFSHLVVDMKTLDQFGTALNSGTSLFLYGPPGTGKTTMAETLSKVLAEDHVWLPHAIEIDNQVITIYDPSIHRRAVEEEPANFDERWVLCHRPTVLAGGELTAEMLDLQFNQVTKYYVCPLQMKANNGLLIIDDFGRQRVRPEELLNRWVVPLDRRIDFLTLAGGKKIEIPFEMMVVFASNMDPRDLGDAAFLRRIQTKIKLGAITDDQFRDIFRQVCLDNKTDGDPRALDYLIDFIRNSMKQELRACYPRDIINQVLWAAKYEGYKPYIDLAAVVRAIEAYFLPPV